ncbi:MAG: hypothetical protein L0H53_08535 [Candidatus Nitrosocosmicus sp.]|nr:hypothetical protein [Candidatus Nitrosocosmicus sp.]MDN5867382.1 hypothetical protein [Candidatus Nitrosocosmicus sp.]
MEKLPYDNNNRGIFDRSFVHYFMNGEVRYNIKEISNDPNSELYKDMLHLRKLLLAFKLVNYYRKFPEIKTNLKGRDAELTHFLLKMFSEGENFESIRSALSRVINEKTGNKSNSIEASIIECLIHLSENEKDKNKEIIHFTNEEFNIKFKEITGAQHTGHDYLGSIFVLPDGTKVGKFEISKLLKSKFKAKAARTNHSRGYDVNRKDITQISKQYVIIKDIKIFDKEGNEIHKLNLDKNVTEVTQVTDFKGATPPSLDLQDNQDSYENDHSKDIADRTSDYKINSIKSIYQHDKNDLDEDKLIKPENTENPNKKESEIVVRDLELQDDKNRNAPTTS